jgi:hypothetical protein
MLEVPESYFNTFFCEGYILSGFFNIEPADEPKTFIEYNTKVVRIFFNYN